MKILLVLTYYRPHWTGLTQYAARLAEGLVEKGHRAEILCSQHQKNLPLKEEIKEVKVFRLPYLFRFLRSVVMPGFPYYLWKKVKESEVVVAYLPLQEVVLVALVGKLLKKKVFLVHNGDLVLPQKGGWKNRLIESLYKKMTGLAISLSQAVIVQTQDYSENSKLLSGFKGKWQIILPLYERPKVLTREVLAFKKKNNLEGKILVGFSGWFVEEKGVDYLLRAIPLVVKKLPQAHFVFAGDCQIKYENFWEEITPLIRKNQKHLTLLGLLKSQKEVFTFYRSLDVLVQPSRTDCFPSSQVEALLSGTPSVCTDIPGARWPVKETKMGKLVKPENSQALAEGIVEVIKSKKEYQKNQKKVKEIFDYQKTLAEYEKLFEKG